MNLELLINEFKTIAEDHSFINRFGNGPISDIELTKGDSNLFPVLWVIPQGVILGENAFQWNLRVILFDIDRQDDSLRNSIMSDTLMTLNDVIVLFRDGMNGQYELTTEPIALPFEQKFTDYCVGWYADITIASESMNSLCKMPIF